VILEIELRFENLGARLFTSGPQNDQVQLADPIGASPYHLARMRQRLSVLLRIGVRGGFELHQREAHVLWSIHSGERVMRLCHTGRQADSLHQSRYGFFAIGASRFWLGGVTSESTVKLPEPAPLLCLVGIPLQRQLQLCRSDLSVAGETRLRSGVLVLRRAIDH
jgi:hypothetical protein